VDRERRRARSRSDSSERPLVQQVQPPTAAIDHEFEEMKWALNMGLIGMQNFTKYGVFFFFLSIFL
jgi:hypothetical protein